MLQIILKKGASLFFPFALILLTVSPVEAKEEKDFDISLVKTAARGDEIIEVDNRKVLTEAYIVKEGDWIWKVLKRKGLLEKQNLAELLAVLKKLNKSLSNLDVIQPGQRIIIPLKISPVSGVVADSKYVPGKVISLAELKDIDFENYTVEKGDSLIKVVRGRYKIPPDKLYGDYLELAGKLNPSIKNLDLIYPGQVIRLPIYTAQVVRKPIDLAKKDIPLEEQSENAEDSEKKQISNENENKTEEAEGPSTQSSNPLARALSSIFGEIGEEWVQTGKHFITLKSGSQMDLNAGSFPMINFKHGQRVIVDLDNKLPEKMVALIESSWGNYRVVHINNGEDFRSAFGKVLTASNYPTIFKKGDPLQLKGQIPFKITGDWIVAWAETGSASSPNVAVINLLEPQSPETPAMIKDYLKLAGVRVVDYPKKAGRSKYRKDIKPLSGGEDAVSCIHVILNLTGQQFSSEAEIPLFQGRQADFKMVSKADFLLKIKNRDAIIDLTGFAPEVVSVLEEQNYRYLPIAGEEDPLERVAKVLIFLDFKFEPGPHSFTATQRDPSRNIKFSIPGIVFSDTQGKSIFATPLPLPAEILSFLSTKGYEILLLPSS